MKLILLLFDRWHKPVKGERMRMLGIGEEKKRRRHMRRLSALAVIVAFALIGGCSNDSSDGAKAVLTPGDNGDGVLDERQTVWRYLKVFSIYHYRLPEAIGSMTPYDMFDCISDTLRGVRYTEYIDERPGGGVLFDPNTEFYDPIELTPSTVYFYLPEFSDAALEFFEMNLPNLSRYPNIIIDVRDNGGGLLSVTDTILDELLPYGTPYVNFRYRSYNIGTDAGETLEEVERTNKRRPALLNKNVAVLINGYSASASEILAAGLKDGAGAYLVGGNSYGKGMGQLIAPIAASGRTKMLSVTYCEISGLTSRTGQYHRVGIEPDPVPEDIASDVDAHIPSSSQLEVIQEVMDAIAETPGIPPDSVVWYQENYRQELIKWFREPYYALKQLDPQFAFPDNGGEMAKQRMAADLMYAESMGKIVEGIHNARARWRPIGAVIADEKDLPNIQQSDD